MPFSDEFLTHARRGTQTSGGFFGYPANQSGIITFTKSTDHASVQSYAVKVYAQGGSTALINKNIGKPTPQSNGDIQANLVAELNVLATGNYTVTVVAISSGGSAESSGTDFSLPLT